MAKKIIWRQELTPSLSVNRFWYLIGNQETGSGVVEGGFFRIRERSGVVEYFPMEIDIRGSGAAKEHLQSIKSKSELSQEGTHILLDALFTYEINEWPTDKV